MKNSKKTVTTLLTVAVLLMVVFAAGRYGWKLLGFRACQGAGIESVEVSENTVKIKGFYPGSFPEGFCGYYAEEQDGTLYVGFRFSTVFGFFETGDFDVAIPVEGEIHEVVLKTENRSVLFTVSAHDADDTLLGEGTFLYDVAQSKIEFKSATCIDAEQYLMEKLCIIFYAIGNSYFFHKFGVDITRWQCYLNYRNN